MNEIILGDQREQIHVILKKQINHREVRHGCNGIYNPSGVKKQIYFIPGTQAGCRHNFYIFA
jgi:hypothetical protein